MLHRGSSLPLIRCHGEAMIQDDVQLQLSTQPSFALDKLDNAALPTLSQSRSNNPDDATGLPGTISQATAFPKHWSRSRVCIATMLSSMYFDMVIGVAVLVNIGLIASWSELNLLIVDSTRARKARKLRARLPVLKCLKPRSKPQT